MGRSIFKRDYCFIIVSLLREFLILVFSLTTKLTTLLPCTISEKVLLKEMHLLFPLLSIVKTAET